MVTGEIKNKIDDIFTMISKAQSAEKADDQKANN